jgi:hypothetical protein
MRLAVGGPFGDELRFGDRGDEALERMQQNLVQATTAFRLQLYQINAYVEPRETVSTV